MNRFIEEIEKKKRELQVIASRRRAATIRRAEVYHEGYIQGTEDLMKAIEDIAVNEHR